MDIIASPSTVIPLLLLLILIIYYLISLTGALREANQDLKNQLRRERQEERRKMLQRVVNAKLDDGGGNNAIDRWRKVLEASSPVTPNLTGQQPEPDEEKLKARREFLARIMKKALRKSSNTSEEDSHVEGIDDDGDETDTEQHEQLPHDQEAAEKRTPTKRKNSSVRLLDDKKVDGSQRKFSLTRLRDITEMARRKSDQSDAGKSSKVLVIKENKVAADSSLEQEDRVNVVSERRALRRQQNARESDGNISLQSTSHETTNFDIVNEKNKSHTDVVQLRKSPPKISSSPEIFKFDTGIQSQRKNSKEESNTKQTSFKEKEKIKEKDSDSVSPSTSNKDSKISHAIAPSSASIPDAEKTPKQTPSPTPSEKSKPSDEILKQPIKKLNSFLALVREAVQAKKTEQQHQKINESAAGSSNLDLQTRCQNFIDDSNPVSMSEECNSIKTTDSATTSSSKITYFESTKRKHRSDPPKPKRQDSQASIWSENIPVIRISKSESNECILERNHDDSSQAEKNKEK